jgi:opacity protein-like surface antigen
MFGIQAGANGQSGSTVFGIELDLSVRSRRHQHLLCIFRAYVSSTATCARTTWHADRRSGGGNPQGRTLLYGKAGAAFGSDDLTARPVSPPAGLCNNGPKFGWTVGAGVEHALVGNWTIKGEYDYLAFGDTRFSVPASAFNPGAPVLVVPLTSSNVSQDIHQFKIGVNYKLGADPRSVDPVWHQAR